jgi:predicted RecB family nuclease
MSTPQKSYRKKRLSKSDYLAGLQCPKHLWLRVNEPDATELEIDTGLEGLFEQGRRVGELARNYVPGGTLIDYPYYAIEDKLRATKRALDEGIQVIYEAAFAVEGLFVAIDILERTPDGFNVTEVKSSTKVKDEHLHELALQAYVLRRCGIEASRLRVMHLNRDCAYPDLENLFIREDVTEEVRPLIEEVEGTTRAQAKVLAGSLPIVQIGAHCSAPYECAFKSRCWAKVPPHHVTTIHAIRTKKAFALVEKGITTISDLPGDFSLSPTAERQRRAVVEDRLIVEPALADALRDLPSSIGFLDFETVGLAIPVWTGCHPYDAVPVQFSFCMLDSDGELVHSEWLADGPGDPREAMAAALIEACRNAGKIAAYNAGFESRCLRHLAAAVPDLAGELNDIDSRLVDLLPVVRNHVYHPEFYGSFSLKRVFPVMTAELVYDELEIADGSSASWLLQALLFESNRFPADERLRRRQDLLAYCRADTECLAKLLDRLRGLEAGSVEQLGMGLNQYFRFSLAEVPASHA